MLAMEELLKPEDAARILNVSEFTVREMLRDKELKGKKVRGQWRIRPSDLRDYINDTPQQQQPEDK